MRYELSTKRTLIVRGPASIDLQAGQATTLGAPFALHQTRNIAEQRQLPIETESHAEFEVVLGKSGSISEIQGSTIPGSWRRAAAALKEMGEGKVIVLGPTDAGKSTLCTYLVNELLNEVPKLRVVDADVGQTDLGPPTTIARAGPLQPIAFLPELTPDTRLFIGHTSPSDVQHKLIRGVGRLTRNGDRSLTIINTDGWIAERDAVLYKMDLVSDIDPELVLALERGDEVQQILAGVRVHSMKVEAAEDALKRSRGDRRGVRVRSYQRFLAGATVRSVPLRDIQIALPVHFPSATVLNSRRLRNLIVGLLDERGCLMDIGILMSVERDVLRIYSKAVAGFS
jgi:polynucleotide 5'-hydroxyl-kinase GRC3/NOL9